jgi:hypothetical protein
MSIRARANRIGAYRTGYVLEGLLAKISELDLDFAANLLISRRRDADAAGFGNALQPCCDVNTVTENIVALDQNFTEIDPDPEQHPTVFWDAVITLGHDRLHSHRAFDRIDYRGELKQHAVPCGLDKTTPVLRHESISNRSVFAEGAGGTHLVEAHKA